MSEFVISTRYANALMMQFLKRKIFSISTIEDSFTY